VQRPATPNEQHAGRIVAEVRRSERAHVPWVAQLADERGWNFGLYGAGWENHRDFSRYARGRVTYGDQLADLTRRTKVNLQIVPYSCIHQRLLDGVSAGGFFLIRRHPVDGLASEFLDHAVEFMDANVADISTLRTRLDKMSCNWLDDWLNRREQYVDCLGIDPVHSYHTHVQEDRAYLYKHIPAYDKVAFGNRDTLAACLDMFMNSPSLRCDVINQQRSFFKSHYTLCASVERVLHFVANRLEESGVD
jgi:hypothetical protein